MDFYEVLDQVVALLQKRGRLTYGALKRQFHLDEDYLTDLKAELIDGQRVAIDEDGKVLVWVGAAPVSSSAFQVSSSPQSPTPNTQPPSGERRQLTVMFCDLVGSTALSEQLDPEEYREVVRAYQDTCTVVIRRYDGHIAQHLGDGLLVYFGYPAAHEDDAPRAVRTGLAIIAALQGQSAGARQASPLHVRIGIHTGVVVIGEIGSSEKREVLALGETPNLAARLQGLAEPDNVVVSAATQRLVAGLVECQELGSHSLKGISIPLLVYRVVRESAAQNRFEAEVRKGLTPLVGRELEVGLLRERWRQATGGSGQVVLLSGEPGIGKSRLIQALKEQVSAEGSTRIECRCSPYYQHSALYPIIEHLQRLFRFHREDSPPAKLAKLQQALARYRFPQADTVPLLAALLSLPQPAAAPPLSLSPQKQRQKTQDTLVAWLVEEAERQAVYCVWEDLHWADPSTLELLTRFLEQAPTTRLLALLTFRPEFIPPWRARSHITQLTLNRLGRQQVEAMIEKLTGGKPLPQEVVQQIVAKTDGVPLFVEELIKMVLESGLLKAANGHYQLTGPLPPLAIPSTLRDSLMARLDRLATTREIVQLGATLGREFSYGLLHAVSPLDEATLQQGLHQVVEAELLYQRGIPPQATYLFKHALIQDAAYQSLLKSTRQQYHQQIAHVLEEQFPEIKETQPELLSHHYTEAGFVTQAIPYWQRAGQRAIQRSANVEAISYFTNGLELLKTLPDTPERAQQELSLQTAFGSALISSKGYVAPEVESAYLRARELCQQLRETPQLFPILQGLAAFHSVRAEFQTAQELGTQLLTLAHRAQDPAILLRAHIALQSPLFWQGEFTSAYEYAEQGIALYGSLQQRSQLPDVLGQDPGVMCLFYAALALWPLGYPDQALKKVHEAISLAQELSHPFSLAYAYFSAAVVCSLCREIQMTQEQAEAAITLATEHGFIFPLAIAEFGQGWVLVRQGRKEQGLRQMRRSLATLQAMGAEVIGQYQRTQLAEAYGIVGQAEEGLAIVSEAFALMPQPGGYAFGAELYRVKGELTFKSQVKSHKSKVEETEEYFLKAIEVARRQQAKSWELRASTSLARLWQRHGKK